VGVGEISRPCHIRRTPIRPGRRCRPALIAALENLITVRMEYAVGEGGLHGFYVAIGQAF
jgi:hypothetical protein